MIMRRDFLSSACGMVAACAMDPISPAAADQADAALGAGSQRRWRTAFGLNGFMSSEQEFGNRFAIWEVLDFAQREGFDGIELVSNWPAPYPAPEDDPRIDSLRGLYARYNLRIFSIQTGAGGAFHPDREVRQNWLRDFTAWARFAHKAGCECIGLWPGGGLNGQTLDQARDRLIESLKQVGKIVSDEQLMASVEIEPPFEFHTIEDLIQIIDRVDHPLVRGMYDCSHFDLMNGGSGHPEELLERVGVRRLGYIHFTDTDGTIFGGTSRHLACGDGHVDCHKSLEMLWNGGYEGWIMIDAWKIRDPYDACRKGRHAIEAAYKEFFRRAAREKTGMLQPNTHCQA